MTPLSLSNPSFKTHLNYIKHLNLLLSSNTINVHRNNCPAYRKADVDRFRNLYKLTARSINRDIIDARTDPELASITAPWFPVKCYYALYYLEAVFIHLVDGGSDGFSKAGHTRVRTKMIQLNTLGNISFSNTGLNTIYPLARVISFPAIHSGENTRSNYWSNVNCIKSLAKKLLEYALHNKHLSDKWNLKTKKGRQSRQDFINANQLSVIDFFYWYRIKANYKDLDYLDFSNGITGQEAQEYLEAYNSAFNSYSTQLRIRINTMLP